MWIPDVDKLAVRPGRLDLLEIEDTRDAAIFKLGNSNVFGRRPNRGKSVGRDAHVDPKPVMPVSFIRLYPRLDKGRLRPVVIDAQEESIRAIGASGVDEALRENRQAVAAALRQRSVGVYDQQRESVLVRKRSYQQTVRAVALGSAPCYPCGNVKAATNAFDGFPCPTLASPGRCRRSSRDVGVKLRRDRDDLAKWQARVAAAAKA